MLLDSLLRIIRLKFLLIKNRQLQVSLMLSGTHQRNAYEKIKGKFAQIYLRLKIYDSPSLTTGVWNKFNHKLEKLFLPYPPFSFLQNEIILRTMFMTSGGHRLSEQIRFIEKIFRDKVLKRVLKEDFIGVPVILNEKYFTSHNSVWQLYHIARLIKATNCDFKKVDTIVEWGGGYGNLTKVLMRLYNKQKTYVLIDTPFFCTIQWLYLAIIFGENEIHFLRNKKDKIQKNKINILPVGLAKIKKLKCDLFISLWALSESPPSLQNYVAGENWFGAKHILLGYQLSNKSFPNAGRIERLVMREHPKIEDVRFVPGSRYVFL